MKKNMTLSMLMVIAACSAAPAADSLLGSLPASPTMTVSTVPPSGDVNPYGVAFVPAGFLRSTAAETGDILVSNFNNSSNAQGTGSTIVRITSAGKQTVFFQGPTTGVGLTTALGALERGFVLVGNVPTRDGTCATAGAGSLIVLDRFGNQVANWVNAQALDGPWDRRFTMKESARRYSFRIWRAARW